MTSPTDLPFVENGMIWDGATEYQDVLPPDAPLLSVYLLRMVGDESRRYTDYRATANPMRDLLRWRRDGWGIIGVTFVDGGSFLINNPIAYLDYDGSISATPVNQVPYTNHFFERISTFAHDLDDAMGHWTLQSATEEDRMAAYNTIRDMIAFAADKFDVFAAIDPLERIIGGNNDGRLLWKHGLPEALEVFEQVCGNCERKTLLRQVVMNANLPLLRRLYRSGIIYSIDFDLTPWGAQIFGVATDPRSQFYEDLIARYIQLIHYFDTEVDALVAHELPA